VAVLLASLAGWLLSRYLPFTPFEATGLWLLAGSVVTLAAAGLFAAFMASGTQQAQRELLERLSQDADEEDEEDEEARALVFVTPTPRKAVPRRVLAKARRSR
jgi:hypothetical protein